MEEQFTKPKTAAGAIIYWTLAFSLAYAIIRYHIAGDVPWKDFPFFILNKSIAMSAFILLTFNFVFGPLKNLGIAVSPRLLKSRRLVGIMGFIQALIHVFMSFMLFKPEVYSKFFDPNGSISLIGGLSMLVGILAFVILWAYNISFNANFRKDKDLLEFIQSRNTLLIGMLLAGLHLVFMGYSGWMKPGGWGGMPPISLVSFAFFAVGFVINLLGRK